jgi:putative hydrolase of the HAD superfamily
MLSNCYVGAQGVVERLGLDRLFDCVVLSFEVGLAKSDPRAYRLVCRRLACAPQTTFFVGDGNDRELEGARAVGMTAVWIRGRTSALWRTDGARDADHVVDELAHVVPLVLRGRHGLSASGT